MNGQTRRTLWHALDRVLVRLRPHRAQLSLAVDAAVVALCWNVTYLFRLGFERWLSARPSYDGWVLLGVVAIYAVVFVALHVPRAMWRFSGFGEVKRLTIACLAAGLAVALCVSLLGLAGVPRAVLALHPVVTLMGVCLVRIAYRMLYEHARSRITGGDAEVRRAIVFGAGDAARRLLSGIHEQGWIVLAVFDDDPAKQGARIAGVPVLGPLAAAPQRTWAGVATHLIIAMPSLAGARRRAVLDIAAEVGLPVLTVPSARELDDGRGQVDRVREIEPEDVLGREPIRLDEAGIGAGLRGRTVLVTGAGGSIGSELCRQIARCGPARMVLLEQGEFNLYAIEQELEERWPEVPLACLIGDIKDLAHMRRVLGQWRPQIVFHAAAYKHVPLMEQDNAFACLRNNTLGTWHVGLASAECGVERFVLISTDKAVNPTNVMGASKRAAEMAISALAREHPGTRFMAVRFGNVLGSSGSVIPKFKEQIARGGPVTVTHPDIVRYFMTIPEAARLVLQAAAIGQSGQVLVLDMGEAVRIVDLARQMIRLSGHAPEDIPIVFSGLRPGEKLFEELLADGDATLPTPLPRIHLARIADHAEKVPGLIEWIRGREGAADVEVQATLRAAVEEYAPASAAPGPGP
ncbi:MAG TPA: nucleoside-diphosphate sugar epimerase/dehydratase [Burkholderiaceae bacterium]|nr:nucleoside-diphosphate sugar epimerase/dehydratase [Burkholderiaceae bacterium]